MAQPSAAAGYKSFSPRRRLRRRVLIFSGISGVAAVLAGAIVFCVADVYLPLRRLEEANAQTLQRIRCDMQTCDMSDINADPEFNEPDYILDRRTYFFLGTPTIDIPGFPLRYADPTFVRTYETPASFPSPDGEVMAAVFRCKTSRQHKCRRNGWVRRKSLLENGAAYQHDRRRRRTAPATRQDCGRPATRGRSDRIRGPRSQKDSG